MKTRVLKLFAHNNPPPITEMKAMFLPSLKDEGHVPCVTEG